MKTFLKLFFVILFFTSHCFAAVNNAKPISYLYVQNAESGTLTPVKNSFYKLTLKNVSNEISFVSDRPNRLTGLMSLQDFLNIWGKKKKNSFKEIPPNVVIEGIKLHHFFGGKDIAHTVVLRNPQYDLKSRSLTYDAIMIEQGPYPIKTELKHVVLFFDNWCPGCCCG